MSRPSTPSKAANTSTSTRSHREDVLHFLDDLDSFDAPAAASAGVPSQIKANGGASTPKSSTGASTTASTAAPSGGASAGGSEDPQSVLDFLDEIVTRRAPTASSSVSSNPKKAGTLNAASAGNISRSGSRGTMRDKASYLTPRDQLSPSPSAAATTAATTGTSTAALAAEKLEAAPSIAQSESAGGWGWGSVWSQASNMVQQARTVAEEVG